MQGLQCPGSSIIPCIQECISTIPPIKISIAGKFHKYSNLIFIICPKSKGFNKSLSLHYYVCLIFIPLFSQTLSLKITFGPHKITFHQSLNCSYCDRSDYSKYNCAYHEYLRKLKCNFSFPNALSSGILSLLQSIYKCSYFIDTLDLPL